MLSNQYWSERSAGARCGTAGIANCGSNFNSSGAKKMLYAPAAHILSTMFGTWAGGAREFLAFSTPQPILGLAGCTHELFPADSQNNTGATGNPSFNSHYGMCTGTSMSAPILSGLAGLVRSVNPLLSIDDTYIAMQNQSVALTGVIPPSAQNTRQPLADKTLEKTLGQFGGSIAQNRLIPMFAARSSVRDASHTESIR